MTKRINSLLDASHGLDPRSLGALDDADVRAAIDEATGTGAHGRRARAVEILAASRRSDAKASLLKLAGDASVDSHVLSAVAFGLRRHPGQETEDAMLAALSRDDSAAKLSALATLMRVGGAQALAALSSTSATEPTVKRAHGFASSVIAHRVGAPGHAPAVPPPTSVLGLSGPTSGFSAARVNAPRLAELTTSMAGDTFDVMSSPKRCFELSCGGVDLALLLESRPYADSLAYALRTRPILLGVLAKRAEEDGSFSAWRIFLGGPTASGGIYVSAHATDGLLVLYGESTPSAGELDISLQTVRFPGAHAARVQAHASGGDLAVSGLSALTRVPAMTPQPID